MIRLYSAAVCPFAQRTRALITELGIAVELVEIDLDDRDREFLEQSPTGRVPLLIDGRLKLYESQIVNEYLADKHGYADAFDGDPGIRARERLAMVAWDQTIVPAYYASMRGVGSDDATVRQIRAELQELLRTVHMIGKRQGHLLSFHCGPFWARMDWTRDLSPLPGIVDEWIDLKTWLDAAIAVPAIAQTLPDREATVRRYRERFAGGR